MCTSISASPLQTLRYVEYEMPTNNVFIYGNFFDTLILRQNAADIYEDFRGK